MRRPRAAACLARCGATPALRARLTSCGDPPCRNMRRHQRGWRTRSSSARRGAAACGNRCACRGRVCRAPRVDGQQQRRVSPRRGASHQVLGDAPVLLDIQLEPQRPVARRPHVLDQRGRRGGQREGHAGAKRGARQHLLGPRPVEAVQAGRADDHRQPGAARARGRRVDLATSRSTRGGTAHCRRRRDCARSRRHPPRRGRGSRTRTGARRLRASSR